MLPRKNIPMLIKMLQHRRLFHSSTLSGVRHLFVTFMRVRVPRRDLNRRPAFTTNGADRWLLPPLQPGYVEPLKF